MGYSAIFVGSLIIGWLVWRAVDIVAGRQALEFAVAVVPGLIGLLAWVLQGAPLRATLAWVVPLTAAMAASVYIFADPLAAAIQVLGIAALCVMLFWPKAAGWWLGRFRSDGVDS